MEIKARINIIIDELTECLVSHREKRLDMAYRNIHRVIELSEELREEILIEMKLKEKE